MEKLKLWHGGFTSSQCDLAIRLSPILHFPVLCVRKAFARGRARLLPFSGDEAVAIDGVEVLAEPPVRSRSLVPGNQLRQEVSDADACGPEAED